MEHPATITGLEHAALGIAARGAHPHAAWVRQPDIPGAPGDFPANLRQVFYNIMICESTGNPRAIEPPGGVGGPLGHYGLFQFDIPTWESVGGHGNPIDASPEEQWMRAYMLYQRRGLQPWECADSNHLGYA